MPLIIDWQASMSFCINALHGYKSVTHSEFHIHFIALNTTNRKAQGQDGISNPLRPPSNSKKQNLGAAMVAPSCFLTTQKNNQKQ